MYKDRARDPKRTFKDVGSLQRMGEALGFTRHSYKNYPDEAINDAQERRAVTDDAAGLSTKSYDRRGKVGNAHVEVLKGKK